MVKRYPVRYVKVHTCTYKVVDDSGKEETVTEDITFMANGYLFPLFKSIAGIELTDALDDYKKGLAEIITPEKMEVLFKLQEAEGAESKLSIASDNAETILKMLQVASTTNIVGGVGLDLIELIMICTRICALPENERVEAMSFGTEILPEEVYQDTALAFELLQLATGYDDHAKKNSKATHILGQSKKVL